MPKFGGFPGMGGMGNMQNMIRQAQKMQEDLQKAQLELQETEFTGTAGGDMVSVVMTGDKNIVSVSIKPEAVDPNDVEMLEDLIVAALSDVLGQIDDKSKEVMGPMAGMLGGNR